MRDPWSRFSDPEDPAAIAVLADALQLAGDPRGEWISLGLRLEEQPSAALELAWRRWGFEHRHALIGSLATREAHPWWWKIEGGLVRELAINVRGMGEAEVALLDELHAIGLTRHLRRLQLMGTARYDAVMSTVLRLHPKLEILELGPLYPGYGRCDVELQELLDALPRLTVLRAVPAPSLGGLRHARLRRLTICPAEPEELLGFSLVGLPALEHLQIARLKHAGPEALQGIAGGQLESVDVCQAVAQVLRSLPGAARGLRFVDHNPSTDSDPLLTPARQTRLRRFEFDGRFWEIRREDETLHLRYGKGKGRALTKPMRSAYDAANAYRERVSAKQEAGYEEAWIG